MKNYLLILLIIILALSCSKDHKQDNLSDRIKKVETGLINPVFIEGDSTWSIEKRMDHYGVPGVSIAVIKDNKIEWAKTYGVMDKEKNSPVTQTTLFQAGSISKPVAAYGALRLVELNKFDLDADINTYLKSWKLPDNEFTKEKKVKLRNILNHSAGITVHGFLGYSPDLAVPTLLEILNGTAPANSKAIIVDKIPEESFRYSGGGYTIMQQMMIDVEGKSFPVIMKELVLQPLSMNNSTFDQPLKTAQLAYAATGYLPDGTMTKGKRHTYPEMAAAGLWTTAEDLAKFIINMQKTLKGESKIVLTQEMTIKMLTPYVSDFIGLGIFINKMKGEVYFGHGGWDEGFSSEMIAHKEKGYGVVVLTNSNHPEFISELIRSVALTYSWDQFVPVYKRMKVDNTLIGQIGGKYRVDGNKLIEVYQNENLLYMKELGQKPEEIIRISDSTYIRRKSTQLIQFTSNSESDTVKMEMLDPNNGAKVATYFRMNKDEKIPVEFLLAGDFNKAFYEYQTLMRMDPKNSTINEDNLNMIGYNHLYGEQPKLAQDIFKINTLLYPKSSNTYDSYAEACMKNGDIELAIENYKKSFTLDPKNTNAQEKIKELQNKKGN